MKYLIMKYLIVKCLIVHRTSLIMYNFCFRYMYRAQHHGVPPLERCCLSILTQVHLLPLSP